MSGSKGHAGSTPALGTKKKLIVELSIFSFPYISTSVSWLKTVAIWAKYS